MLSTPTQSDFYPRTMDEGAICDDILQVIAKIQAALPSSCKHNRAPISISPAVNVEFPTYEWSLSKLDHLSERAGSHTVTIATQYLQACQRLQKVTTYRYFEVLKSLESLENFGGVSDLSLQSHVARGLSQFYEKWETKLATFIMQRYTKSASSSKEETQIGKVRPPNLSSSLQTKPLLQQKEAIHTLRRAFAVNTHPTDAERDYLAKQTGMTYRQVTVWVRLLSSSLFTTAHPPTVPEQPISSNQPHPQKIPPTIIPDRPTAIRITTSNRKHHDIPPRRRTTTPHRNGLTPRAARRPPLLRIQKPIPPTSRSNTSS